MTTVTVKKSQVFLLVALFLVTIPLLVFGMGARVPVQGMPAAEFQLEDLAGQSHQLSQYHGKVILLNFWATWCKPCTTEMPAMQKAFDQLKEEGLVVLAINELEDLPKVKAHVQEHGHTFPVLLDPDNQVANLYGVFGLPVTVFIDQHGTVQEYIKGGLLTKEKITTIFHTLKNADRKTVRATPQTFS